MAELLLEILSEEIPARMQARAAEDLKRLVCDGLKGAGIGFEAARAYRDAAAAGAGGRGHARRCATMSARKSAVPASAHPIRRCRAS
jgi:hypothetical protein